MSCKIVSILATLHRDLLDVEHSSEHASVSYLTIAEVFYNLKTF